MVTGTHPRGFYHRDGYMKDYANMTNRVHDSRVISLDSMAPWFCAHLSGN